MKRTAIAKILVEANKDGEAYTLSIGMTGGTSCLDVAVVKFDYDDNFLQIKDNYGQVYLDGDQINCIKVNK